MTQTVSTRGNDGKYSVLSLFAGIGGFDLGLERTGGFETVAFCEIDKKAQQVLRKHWPEVPIYDDVSTLTAERLAADGIAIDVIVGGFPCQDISNAGRREGLAGERSGLWAHYERLIGELRPRYVIVENVSALLVRGIGDVLRGLAALGYDAEWHCIPASYVGAPHRRDRVWILAHPNQQGLEGRNSAKISEWCAAIGHARQVAWWTAEPAVGRVAHGVPGRVDRLKQLGNAVVPQIPELIGRAILAAEAA